MAKAHLIKQVKIILELTKDEADFIKGMVQNALVDNESEKDANVRRDIFDALSVPSLEKC